MPAKSYRDLKVWQLAMDLVVETYRLTKQFPQQERFGLTSQLNRAAVSVPSNIAEGYWRLYRKEYVNYLSISRGSLAEAETQVIVAARLEYVARDQAAKWWELAQQTGRALNGLLRSLSSRKGRSQPEPQPEP